MKVVVGYFQTDPFLNELRSEFPGVEFQPAATEEEQRFHIQDADIFLGVPSREVFLAAEKLRWLHCPGTGVDRLMEIPEIADSDVVLTNARGPHTNPMADHAFGMILTFAHHMRELWDDQRARRWDLHKYNERMIELDGATMGILGLGGIGRAVARRALGFGMDVFGVDADVTEPPVGVNEVWPPDRLDDLLKISDWFVVAVPYTAETDGIIDGRRIGLMKPGSYMIVLSRGGIVDEDAVVEALGTGQLAGVGLDVTAVEPLPQDSPLWEHENVIISPHVSALTPEMWEGRRQLFKENLRRFLANEPFLYVVDKKAGY